MTSYYHLTVKGKEIKDVVWYYKYPTAESALVVGRFCFYNEKVDVFIDGVKEVEEKGQNFFDMTKDLRDVPLISNRP